ncbi:MAG: hypothetical protein N2202_09435 [Proteobacteria bacterium]|nr:hypothetical protein [Pseudomonadota bacterium]
MRRFYLLFFILFFTKNVFALTIAPKAIDFGKVKKFHQSKRYILFSNNTEKDIEILGIVNACGLALTLDKKILKSGEVTEGVLFFDAGTPQGSFEEYVKLVYKEGENLKEDRIKVSWYTYPDRYPEIVILKREFNLGEVLPKTPIYFDIEVKNTGNMVLTVNSLIEEGFLINLPVDIQPGETKVIKGSLVIEKPEKSEKVLVLETNDLSNPKVDLKFYYDAKWDIKRGVNFFLERARKTNDGYEIPVKVFSKDFDITDIFFEDIEGKQLNTEKKILFKNEEGVYVIRVDEKEYEKLKNSYLYIKIGIPIEN